MSEFNNEEKINAEKNEVEVANTSVENEEKNEEPTDTSKDVAEEEFPVISEETDIKEKKNSDKKSKIVKDIVDYIEMFVFAVGFVMLLFSFCCRLCTVSGPSMNNTLIDGEKVIISDVFYTPKRGDIIVFHDTNTLNEPVIKRVIATEGERVAITYFGRYMKVSVTDKDGNVTLLEEDYIVYEGPTYAPATYYVPEGSVFVMGDNRSHSMDSRHPDVGFVDERSILGRVLFRITPINKFGTVE